MTETLERALAPLLTFGSFCDLDMFEELKMCLHDLAIIDEPLEALGTLKEYQKLNNWIIRIIIGLIVYVFFNST
ncbi:hypothetical protein ALC60_01847 [Trachymyrmex zeteki]|uniref:Uncharacterized protein n=1 Tax=Mycetomoellerius zeteki TaxID=64791 RepID=A0A151XFS8_9HYME|nr:hypothetical protein ALC60_01847 [Trachymyrmex zeteki]